MCGSTVSAMPVPVSHRLARIVTSGPTMPTGTIAATIARPSIWAGLGMSAVVQSGDLLVYPVAVPDPVGQSVDLPPGERPPFLHDLLLETGLEDGTAGRRQLRVEG
jgi:hypothetical protein